MRRVKVLLVCLAVMCLLPVIAFSQNARIQALGNPNIGLTNLVNDISDMLTYPSDIAFNMDLVHGSIGATVAASTNPVPATPPGYILATKSILDVYSIGIIFGQPNHVSGYTLAAPAGFGGWTNTGYTSFQAALNNEYPNVSGLPQPAAVATNVGHLLAGAKLDDLGVGIDLFKESANGNSESKISVGTTTTERTSELSTGSMGAILGGAYDLGTFNLKLSLGYVLYNHKNEVITKNPAPVGTVTQRMEKDGGFLLPVALKASLPLNPHTINIGLDFVTSNAGFKIHNDPGSGLGVTDTTSAKYSNMYYGFGIADEIAISDKTKFVAAISTMRSATTQTPDGTLTAASPENSSATTVGPAFSVGIEHRVLHFWKLDEIIFRAGGAKTNLWNSTSSNYDGGGGTGDAKSSTVSTNNPFSWTTGFAVVKGDMQLEMVVAPGSWNGVQFINNRGPITANVGLTYFFGGKSQASTTSTPSYSPPPPPPPAAAPESAPQDDFLNF